ncbi:Zinc finger MYND domain-containing protein 10 [Oleoguttula sp. CCFEE 5521]
MSSHLCGRADCGNDAPAICANCRDIWYCSKACQTQDRETHKIVCARLLAGRPDPHSYLCFAIPQHGKEVDLCWMAPPGTVAAPDSYQVNLLTGNIIRRTQPIAQRVAVDLPHGIFIAPSLIDGLDSTRISPQVILANYYCKSAMHEEQSMCEVLRSWVPDMETFPEHPCKCGPQILSALEVVGEGPETQITLRDVRMADFGEYNAFVQRLERFAAAASQGPDVLVGDSTGVSRSSP